MIKKITYILMIIMMCLPCLAFADDDHVQCAESEGRIFCNISVPDFIQKSRPLLTNGWENTLTINIYLLDNSGTKTIQRSKLEATQRCYLDPFESPCLILWNGASNWQRYRDEDTFLKAMSRFAIQALTLHKLPADNYVIRITFQIMASASKRLQSIQTWFKQNSESGTFFGNGSLIGSFLGSRAQSTENNDIHSITLDTAQFYIDINFKAIEQDDETYSKD